MRHSIIKIAGSLSLTAFLCVSGTDTYAQTRSRTTTSKTTTQKTSKTPTTRVTPKRQSTPVKVSKSPSSSKSNYSTPAKTPIETYKSPSSSNSNYSTPTKNNYQTNKTQPFYKETTTHSKQTVNILTPKGQKAEYDKSVNITVVKTPSHLSESSKKGVTQIKNILVPKKTLSQGKVITDINNSHAKDKTVVIETNATATATAIIHMASDVHNVPLMVDPAGKPTTVYEAVTNMPKRNRDSIATICTQQIQTAKAQGRIQDYNFWNKINRTVTSPDQNACIGKSYGDPHMRTYDGYTYDLQSVGEFVLTKSNFSSFEIQTRQSSAHGRVSLNTAVAMNVNGDRICVYTAEFPDNHSDIEVRLNGDPLKMAVGESYVLNKGGIIRKESTENQYRISWPTGEQTLIKFFSNKGKRYINVLPQVFAAGNWGGYSGLLGNADGYAKNDLISKQGKQTTASKHFYSMSSLALQNVSNNARKSESQFNKSIVNSFAESWRVEVSLSLFDYKYGTNTNYFKGTNNPKKMIALTNLSKASFTMGEKACKDAGIKDEDVLRGCILDVATSQNPEIATAIADIENDENLVKEMKITNKLHTPKFE